MEGRRQGTCHFAGEHTSIDFQGYLNGAVETGERAAAEILADLK
jgi:monoamine oxidase